MYKFFIKPYGPIILKHITYSLLFFLIVHILTFQYLTTLNLQQYWIAISVLLFFIVLFIKSLFNKINFPTSFLCVVSLISLFLMFLSKNIDSMNAWFSLNLELIAFIIVVIFFVNLIVDKNIKPGDDLSAQNIVLNKLFNLFYINTSKVHEIVMLIDNKIMKTVEREQISEELLKYHNSASVGFQNKLSSEMEYVKEDNTKKRVYENFDVKTTKSIMLRKIYETTQINKGIKKLNLGDVTIFENIELEQRNIDDTVMILNILQDSKIKSETNENLEVNLNKMMEKMLNDFTIDYVFSSTKQDESNDYIIQLPYKSIENFENGYQHNDLQLGKLSLIGIYRGEIDFSTKDSMSSKFLQMMSNSYNTELQQNNVPSMMASNTVTKKLEVAFEFNHKKLEKKLHLIDVIAIIQELNIDR